MTLPGGDSLIQNRLWSRPRVCSSVCGIVPPARGRSPAQSTTLSHFMAIEQAGQRVSEQWSIQMIPMFSLMLTQLNLTSSDLAGVLRDWPGMTSQF